METKLQLKHLACYLPYGLTFLSHKHRFKFGEKTILIARGMSLQDDGELNIEFLYNDDLVFSNEMNSCKPLLRPLDLTKPIEIDGETFVPIVALAKIAMVDWPWDRLVNYEIDDNLDCCLNVDFKQTPDCYFGKAVNTLDFYASIGGSASWVKNQLQLFQKLYEWHFDLENLIDQGLAIDLTLKK